MITRVRERVNYDVYLFIYFNFIFLGVVRIFYNVTAIQYKYKMTKLNNPVHTGGAGRLATDPEGCITCSDVYRLTLSLVA